MEPQAETQAIARRVADIREAIRRAARRTGRDPSSVRLLAATKTVDVERLRAVLGSGVRLFGENRLQEALPKLDALQGQGIEWHFIGRLQRRKVKQVVGRFALIHSVESLELAEEIQRRSQEAGIRQAVLLEVNVGGEATKGGFAPEEAVRALPQLAAMPNVQVSGLMTIPPPTDQPEDARNYFRLLRELREAMRAQGGGRDSFEELSMGMSHDFEVAVEEGATIVRVGTGILGARPPARG